MTQFERIQESLGLKAEQVLELAIPKKTALYKVVNGIEYRTGQKNLSALGNIILQLVPVNPH
jgi:hypothetical protein